MTHLAVAGFPGEAPAASSGMLATIAATPSPAPGRSSASSACNRKLYAAASSPVAVRLWHPLTARLLREQGRQL